MNLKFASIPVFDWLTDLSVGSYSALAPVAATPVYGGSRPGAGDRDMWVSGIPVNWWGRAYKKHELTPPCGDWGEAFVLYVRGGVQHSMLIGQRSAWYLFLWLIFLIPDGRCEWKNTWGILDVHGGSELSVFSTTSPSSSSEDCSRGIVGKQEVNSRAEDGASREGTSSTRRRRKHGGSLTGVPGAFLRHESPGDVSLGGESDRKFQWRHFGHTFPGVFVRSVQYLRINVIQWQARMNGFVVTSQPLSETHADLMSLINWPLIIHN